MEANFFLEMNSKVHLSLGKLGNMMDIVHWKFCRHLETVYFAFLLWSCIMNSEAKILDLKSVNIFSRGKLRSWSTDRMFLEALFQWFSYFVLAKIVLSPLLLFRVSLRHLPRTLGSFKREIQTRVLAYPKDKV